MTPFRDKKLSDDASRLVRHLDSIRDMVADLDALDPAALHMLSWLKSFRVEELREDIQGVLNSHEFREDKLKLRQKIDIKHITRMVDGDKLFESVCSHFIEEHVKNATMGGLVNFIREHTYNDTVNILGGIEAKINEGRKTINDRLKQVWIPLVAIITSNDEGDEAVKKRIHGSPMGGSNLITNLTNYLKVLGFHHEFKKFPGSKEV